MFNIIFIEFVLTIFMLLLFRGGTIRSTPLADDEPVDAAQIRMGGGGTTLSFTLTANGVHASLYTYAGFSRPGR